jgi:hypothetical protein
VSGNSRAATRGGGDVIEMECGITVYPARPGGGRWRAVVGVEECGVVVAVPDGEIAGTVNPGPRDERDEPNAGQVG